MNVGENSPLRSMFQEHFDIARKYFYGYQGNWSYEILGEAAREVEAFNQKYAGERSEFVRNLSSALYGLILDRYKEAVLYGKGLVKCNAINHLVNSNKLYNELPDFYERLWTLFAKYANGVNGSFDISGFESMYNETLESFKEDMDSEFCTMMLSAVLSFWDENTRLHQRKFA